MEITNLTLEIEKARERIKNANITEKGRQIALFNLEEAELRNKRRAKEHGNQL